MSTHNICFHGEIRKIFSWYLLLSGAIFFVCFFFCFFYFLSVCHRCDVMDQSVLHFCDTNYDINHILKSTDKFFLTSQQNLNKSAVTIM